MSIHDSAQREGGPPRTQVRLLAAGGALGATLLAASLAVDLSGANDPPAPSIPTPSGLLPTSFPSMPAGPGATDLPTGIPSFSMPAELPTELPTDLPTAFPTDLPTDLPSMPELPGLSGGGS
ncbi:hypothetical protein [Streptomyces sp. NPDC054940]